MMEDLLLLATYIGALFAVFKWGCGDRSLEKAKKK